MTYIGIDIIDFLDGRLDITSKDGIANGDSFLHVFTFPRNSLNVRLARKALGRFRKAFANQEVHDDHVEITKNQVRTVFCKVDT